jgi:hypothetical protein
MGGAATASRDAARPSVVQRGVFVASLLSIVWSVAGLIANPSFATGAAATSERVLGVDFNAWHAISGLLLFIPGLVSARRRRWAILFAAYAMVAMASTGVLALFDSRPYGLFPFSHQNADAILHFSSTAVFGAVLLAEWTLRRRVPPQPSTA